MQPTDETPSETPSEPIVVPSAPLTPMVVPTTQPAPTVVSPETVEPPTAPPVSAPFGQTINDVAQPTPPPVSEPTSPVVVSSPTLSETPNSAPPVAPKKRRRRLWILGGSALLVVLLATATVFGWYLPNTPTNVYNTAITRSGKAVNSLVQDATEKQKLDALKTSKISGSVDVTYGGGHYSGDFNTSFDKTSSTGGLNVNFKGASGSDQHLSLNGLSQIPSGSVYPNVYFQLTGIKNLGLDEFVPGISNYDGKWIFVSSSYLQSLGDEFLKTDDNTKTSVTTEDVAEVTRAVGDVSQDYLFSTASDKAVLEKRSYVGKEEVDGLQAYHYKVAINVAHAKAYCKALSNAVLSTAAYKKVTGHEASATDKTAAANSCETGDYSSLSDTYDLWIDGHYKLIYKVRFYNKSDHGSYADVGQIYKGGDKLSLFVRGHDTNSKTDGSLTVDTDLKTNQTTGDLAVKSTDSTTPYDVKVNLKAELDNEAVKVTPPTTSVKIEDVLKQFGIDPSAAATSLNGNDF